MEIDPTYDAVITRPGKCTGCGGDKPESQPGDYCAKCISHVAQTAQAQRDAAPRDDGNDAARKELAQRELCRRRLLPYVKRLLPNYKAGWFHRDLAARLERFARRVERGESPRLIIATPPRHGKSEQASKAFVSWFLGRNPSKQIIAATHSDKLATDNSRDVLEYIQDDRHKTVFSELALNKDQKGATGWRTSQGGSYKPVGVGAGISGYGADVLIIDDPHRDKDAYSSTVRDSIQRWYDSSATTRLMPGGGVILIQCMVGGTAVLMVDGTERPLRDIRPGDMVASYKGGELVPRRVLNWANQGKDRTYAVTLNNGKKLRANARHPFLVVENGRTRWIQLKNLRPGMSLVVTATPYSELSITSTRIEAIEPDGFEEVFDIQVEGTENFIANSAVSHNTRWVMDDLTGRVLDEEGSVDDGGDWEVVSYPAEAEKDEYRLPDGQIVHEPKQAAQLLRRKGEALHPERWPLHLLERHKKDPVVWQALYQQNPIAGEAAQFRRDMFPEVYERDVPSGLVYYSTWDTALGLKEQNDYTVRILFGVDRDDNVWIVDVARGKWDSSDIADMMIDDFFHYSVDVTGVEKTHQSMSIEPFLEKRIEERRAFGLYVHYLEHGNKDKVARSRPMQARAKQGKVLIPCDAEWFEPFMKEVEVFPGGKHDDQADAFSYAGQLLNEVTQPRERRQKPKKSFRDNLRKYRKGGAKRSWKVA